MDDALASRLPRYAPSRTYLLEALHDAQELFGGWLPRPAVEQIATYLGVPVADVYGVIEFYEMFRAEPVGRKLIRVCQDGPCAVAGADELTERLCRAARHPPFTRIACPGANMRARTGERRRSSCAGAGRLALDEGGSDLQHRRHYTRAPALRANRTNPPPIDSTSHRRYNVGAKRKSANSSPSFPICQEPPWTTHLRIPPVALCAQPNLPARSAARCPGAVRRLAAPACRGANRDLSRCAGGRRLRRDRVLRDVPGRAGRPQTDPHLSGWAVRGGRLRLS